MPINSAKLGLEGEAGKAFMPPLALIFFGGLKFFFVLNKFQLKMLHCFVQAVAASFMIGKMYVYASTFIFKIKDVDLCLERNGSETLSGQAVYSSLYNNIRLT